MLRFKSSNLPVSGEHLETAEKAIHKLFSDESIGFLKLGIRINLFESARLRAKEIRQTYSKVILIGIGGSSLGPQLIKDIYDTHNQIFILDNLDPLLLDSCLNWAQDLKDVHTVVVSKSGKTLETLVLADIIAKKYIQSGLSLSTHFTCITEPVDQDLTRFSNKYHITFLELPVDIGGRYSVLTPVGTLILSYLNQDLQQVQQGIQKALDAKGLSRDLVAASLCSFEKNCKVTAFWSYSSKLKFFSAWFQQLWSESLGKPGAQVSTLLPLVGAIDQHSVLQQLIEGESQSWSILIALDSFTDFGPVFSSDQFKSLDWADKRAIGDLINAECVATYSALNQSSRFASLFYLKDLSPESLGYIFMLSQVWVASLGFALNINPFDQPGVELGKRLIKSLV